MRSASVILEISLALPPTAKQPRNSWDPEIPILQIFPKRNICTRTMEFPFKNIFSSIVHCKKDLLWIVISQRKADYYDFNFCEMNQLE